MPELSISILMPVYNAAPFLEACLESIINQSEENWELLVVDDFSSDESRQILERFAQKDDRIRIFDNLKKGIIPALQLAFKHSKGTYITRMDADDIMAADKLQQLKSGLEQKGRGYCSTGWVQYFSEGILGNGYQRYEAWLNHLTLTGSHYHEIYRECVIPSPCWMIHRSDLIKCGGLDSLVYPEDYDLCFRFYKQSIQIVGICKVLHFWRDHSTRASRNDPNYLNPNYFELKVPYFLELDYDQSKKLVLWGGGKKGKAVAKMLIQRRIPFHWVCDNRNKWGKDIFGKIMESPNGAVQGSNSQFIILVSNPEEQQKIRMTLELNDQKNGRDFFFFC